jgi:hypothetical protein
VTSCCQDNRFRWQRDFFASKSKLKLILRYKRFNHPTTSDDGTMIERSFCWNCPPLVAKTIKTILEGKLIFRSHKKIARKTAFGLSLTKSLHKKVTPAFNPDFFQLLHWWFSMKMICHLSYWEYCSKMVLKGNLSSSGLHPWGANPCPLWWEATG